MWSTSTQRLDAGRLTRGRARRYAWAVGSGALTRCVGPLLSLLITPYALSKLGAERYGLFALALTVSGWLALLDPGLAPGLRVVLARRSDRLNVRELAPLLGSAAAGQRALAAVTLVVGTALAFVVPALLSIPEELRAEATTLLLCIAAGTAAVVFGRHYAAALDACQFASAERLVRLGQSVLRMALLAALLALGWGLQSAGWSYAIAAVAATAALWLSARRLLPELDWRGATDKQAFRELLRPGAWMSAGAVAGVLIVGLDRAVTARFLSLEAVTTFALTGASFLLAESVLTTAVDAARPALAQALGRGRRDEARLIYVQLASAATGLAPAAALGLIAANAGFVTAWTGAESYGGLALDAWFGLTLFVNLWSLPHRALLSADLRAREATLWRLAEGGLNVTLSVGLALRFGVAGVAAGTAIAGLLTSCWALPRLAASAGSMTPRSAVRPLGRGLALLAAGAPFAALAREAALGGGFLAAAGAGLSVFGLALMVWCRATLPEQTRRSWIDRLRARRRIWSAA